MTDLHALSTDYQTLLEKHRLDADCEATWQLYVQTRSQLEREWLEHLVTAVPVKECDSRSANPQSPFGI